MLKGRGRLFFLLDISNIQIPYPGFNLIFILIIILHKQLNLYYVIGDVCSTKGCLQCSADAAGCLGFQPDSVDCNLCTFLTKNLSKILCHVHKLILQSVYSYPWYE